LNHGATRKEIARRLGRHPSTIGREIARNGGDGEYRAAAAQWQAERRRRERPLRRKMDDPAINQAVRSGLAHHWSPEQIAGRMRRAGSRRVSPQTIYAWIKHDPHRKHWESFLRRRGKRPRRRKNAVKQHPIADRPEVVERRLRLGDFEGDTVLGSPGTGGLATLVDRKSRFTILAKIRSKDADHVHEKIKSRLQQLDAARRRSITFDNGREFARCRRLEQHLGMELYFADPGCPFQRGTNENTNGLVRQFFPKGTDFRHISHSEARQVENLLNDRPRACLAFRTPAEVFFEKTPPTGCD
jgi:IS30 family transposase